MVSYASFMTDEFKFAYENKHLFFHWNQPNTHFFSRDLFLTMLRAEIETIGNREETDRRTICYAKNGMAVVHLRITKNSAC